MYSTTGAGAAHPAGADARYDTADTGAMYLIKGVGAAITTSAGVMYTGAGAVYTAELAPRRMRLMPTRCARPLVLAPHMTRQELA